MRHEFILEDLALSLVEFENVLQFKPQEDNVILNGLILDAQIQCFRNAALHFEEFLYDLVEGVDLQVNQGEFKTEVLLKTLLALKVIDMQRADMYLRLFASAALLGMRKQDLSEEEELSYYDI